MPGASFNAGMDGVTAPDAYGDNGGPAAPGNPGFLPGVSPDASAYLSGGGGISARPRLSDYLSVPPRPEATRKVAKGKRTTRPRGRAGTR